LPNIAPDRDLAEVNRLGLRLAYTVDTHIHADHITAALELKKKAGSRIAAPAHDRLPCVDLGITEGKPLNQSDLVSLLLPCFCQGVRTTRLCGKSAPQPEPSSAA